MMFACIQRYQFGQPAGTFRIAPARNPDWNPQNSAHDLLFSKILKNPEPERLREGEAKNLRRHAAPLDNRRSQARQIPDRRILIPPEIQRRPVRHRCRPLEIADQLAILDLRRDDKALKDVPRPVVYIDQPA